MRRFPAHSRLATVLLTIAAVLAIPAAALSQRDAFPDTTGAAIRVYEEEAEPEEWASGPVEYIMLDYERDIWGDVRSAAEREAFIQWFWDRRDNDPRDDEHAFRQGFYERVARANQRFSGFPRGWRSDRGRVWIILGQPNGGMRRTGPLRYGRCRGQDGEWWTYHTNSMQFAASMGEFHVLFLETRVGEYEICDPSMMGPGALPVDLRRAFEIVNESAVIDTVTEFEGEWARGGREASRLPVRDLEGDVSELDVPAAEWGLSGVGAAVVIPVRLPLGDLLFEPQGDVLRATLDVEASLVAMGEGQGMTGAQQWTVELGPEESAQIGGGMLRSALVLPGEPGGYSVRVQISDPLSGRHWVWDGSVELRTDGSGATPPLVGRHLLPLREGGEVAVLSQDPPVLTPGGAFAAVTWVRGVEPATEQIRVVLVDASNEETQVEIGGAAWGGAAAAGPLGLQMTLPDVSPGRYVLRFELGAELGTAERVIRVE